MRKKNPYTILILFLLVGIGAKLFGQCPVDTDGLTRFNTQAEIDAFATIYPNCTAVIGLRIVSVGDNNISNLSPLQQIDLIGEEGLVIENTQLETLNGLQNIQSILADCFIQNNTLLTNLDGLNGLEEISGNLRLINNGLLHDLTALSNLSQLGGLEISNSALSSVEGLEQVTTIEQDVIIRNNPQLQDLSAFQNLTSIEGELRIWDMLLIKSLQIFQDLSTLNTLSILRNPLLSTCELPAICNLLDQTTAQLVVRENGCGCNNRQELEAACNGFEGIPTCLTQDISRSIGEDFTVSVLPEEVDAGSTDDCSLELQLDQSTFDCSNLGENLVTLSAIDNEGQVASCTATVTIVEENFLCTDAPLILSIPDLTFPCEGATLRIPILATNFNEITTLRLSLAWDATVLRYSNISMIGLPGSTIENDFVLRDVAAGRLGMGWIAPSETLVNLADGVVLFEVEMEVLNPLPIEFQFFNEPLRPIEASGENFQAKEVLTNNGSISIPDCSIPEPIDSLPEPMDSLPQNGCCPDLENLLENGDFEQGNTLFESDYQHEPSIQPDAILPGSYGVLTRSEALTVCPRWLVDDHTTNCDSIGNFLVINGRTGLNTTPVIWEQPIDSLQIEMEYSLCGYFKNLQQCCFDVTPTIYFKVDGVAIDTFSLNQSNPFDPCSWQEFNTSFIASSPSQVISLCLDENTLGDGNDIAIDDLSLNKIPLTDFFLSVQDQRPKLPEITASINLIGTADDTLPSPDCNYEWTIALVDSININTQNIFLNPTNMMMGNAATGWGLTTSFPGYSSGAVGGGIGEGIYYISLEMSNCPCAGDKKEAKVVGWRWSPFRQIPDEKDWQLSESSLQFLQGHRTKYLNQPNNEND